MLSCETQGGRFHPNVHSSIHLHVPPGLDEPTQRLTQAGSGLPEAGYPKALGVSLRSLGASRRFLGTFWTLLEAYQR